LNEAMLFWVAIIVCAAVVLYLIWSRQHEREQSQHQSDHRDLVQEVQREVARQHTEILCRCAELQRKLDEDRRTLAYVARRLS